jgi:hypothetical protein
MPPKHFRFGATNETDNVFRVDAAPDWHGWVWSFRFDRLWLAKNS